MDDFLIFDESIFRDMVKEVGEETARQASADLAEAASAIAKDSDRDGYAESYYITPAGGDEFVMATDHPDAVDVELGSSVAAPLSPMLRAMYELESNL